MKEIKCQFKVSFLKKN